MAWINPLYEEHQRKRWMRHDAHLFAPPNPDERKSFAARLIEQRRAAEEEAACAAEREVFERDLAHLRWMVADLKLDLAVRRLRLKYSPDQPRDERGRWTDAGQGGDEGDEGADDGGGDSQSLDVDEGGDRDSAPKTPAEIIATAKRLNLAARPDSYMKCLDLCFPILERRRPAGSDINTFDFYKCMNACLARNPL